VQDRYRSMLPSSWTETGDMPGKRTWLFKLATLTDMLLFAV
jgi:hypothetical protein